MDVPFDGQEIVIISPEALKIIAEIKKRREERDALEKALREQTEAAGIAIRVIMDAIREAAEALSDAFRQISELWDEIAEIIDYDPADATLKRWRAAERRYSAVNMVRYKQFERERANRSAVLRGNIKIGRSGRRTGPKKRKNH